MDQLKERINVFIKYRHLFQELVSKDIKLKYRRSFLGYLWSILNPLMTMVVLVIVFSNMFRFDIENYPVYLIIGQILFSFLTESTSQAIFSITGNSALLKKTYVPKYEFTLARITSSLVNLIFSLGAMIIVFLICKVRFTVCFFWIPVVLVEIYVFCLGLGMFLAQAAVFFRDVQYIYGVLTTVWMYLTPIFYPLSALPENIQRMIKMFNPMYFYIEQFRYVVLNGGMPDIQLILCGCIVAVFMLLIGTWTFSKTQDKFILYI